MAEQSTGDFKTVDWGKDKVLVDDRFKANLNEAVAQYNQTTGKNLTAEQYDRQMNPTTAGARWGDTPPPKPSGLLGSSPSAESPAASAMTQVPRVKAATYTPTEQKTSPQSLVQNQLAAITSTGSKLNDLAEAKANQQASRRGLLNSSMAVEGAQKAVLESALPIAQQDASAFASADSANAQFRNAADQFNASSANNVNLAGMQAALQQRLAEIQSNTSLSVADKQIAAQKAIADSENSTKLQMQKIDGQLKTALQGMDESFKLKNTQLEADNRQLLQTNISAANAYAQYAQALANISISKDMGAAAKQQAADNQLQALQATLRAIGEVSKLDLSKYFQSVSTSMLQDGATSSSGSNYATPNANNYAPL